jgi:hypothetical protein
VQLYGFRLLTVGQHSTTIIGDGLHADRLPHCTTSFAINPAALGAAHFVRCSAARKCGYLPGDALETVAQSPAMAAAGADPRDVAAEWDAHGQEDGQTRWSKALDLGRLASTAQHETDADWTTAARHGGR